MSFGPLLRTLLTRSVTTRGVRTGSGERIEHLLELFLVRRVRVSHYAYMPGGMMTGALSWTWPSESCAVVVRTVQLSSHWWGSSSGSDGSGQNSYRPANVSTSSFSE